MQRLNQIGTEYEVLILAAYAQSQFLDVCARPSSGARF